MERRRFGGGHDRGGGSHSGFGGGFGGGSRGGFGGHDRGGFSDKPKPVKVGEEYDVKISDVGAKGDGITKVENFIVFVPGAAKGEECRIRIKEVANKFAIAEKVSASEKSSNEDSVKEESSEARESEEQESEEFTSDADEEA
jgi:predicted RNA-binding protein with TRAM domain